MENPILYPRHPVALLMVLSSTALPSVYLTTQAMRLGPLDVYCGFWYEVSPEKRLALLIARSPQVPNFSFQVSPCFTNKAHYHDGRWYLKTHLVNLIRSVNSFPKPHMYV